MAAKAIDRPKTIWISRRKPPDVSPKASARPVAMMMMTATILATGPSIDWRIFCSGCFPRHGRAGGVGGRNEDQIDVGEGGGGRDRATHAQAVADHESSPVLVGMAGGWVR